MLERLTATDNPLQVSSFLNSIVLPSFRGVVSDNHFQIHNSRFWSVNHSLYMSEEFNLYKDENVFFTIIDGALHRILEVTHNGQPVDGVLPTISADGSFCWVFGLVKEVGRSVTEISVSLENSISGLVHSHSVKLNFVYNPRQPTRPLSEVYEISGVTVMVNRTLNNMYPIAEQINFFRSATLLRDKPVLIIDLRDNNGGNLLFPSDWVRLYTGHETKRNLFNIISDRQRSLVETEFRNFFTPHSETLQDNLRSSLNALTSPVSSSDVLSSTIKDPPLQVPIQNENLVIVLINKNIISAGEAFIGHLRQLENVLFVGANTSVLSYTDNVIKI